MKHIIFFTFIILISACSSQTGVYKKSEEVNNTLIKNISSPWSELNAEGSDYALSNNETHSIFLFNSACRKYEGSNLSALTSSILSGMEELKILNKKNTYYQEREAVEVLASGKLDGVLRFFQIITIQKNNCIYDYILISTNLKNLELDSPAMKSFLQRIILK